ncbi:MAG: hypothetical protein U0133_01310 [Gemmatimonadales bacterium]
MGKGAALLEPERGAALEVGGDEQREGGERCCSRLSFTATSTGEPTEMMMPPSWSESTQRCATAKCAGKPLSKAA